ncbi:hypothetical protein CMV_020217 [Castanea mollissima]|uniref:SPARK domain-containing protein n=1 Tax=Castanea mollissima TaxID=60419 RepID=A0A8J4QR27_9ROSI|nr:hypothetical protein CMV_020217 [Castanea mollissima]
MKNLVANSGLLLIAFLLCSVSLLNSADSNTSATCPMDLSYVLRIPWNQSLCQKLQPAETINVTTAQNTTMTASCCQTLLSLFAIGLAQHLKETSLFNLPDLPTSISCLNDLQSKITALSLPTTLVSSCLDPLQFVISPNVCAHIETTKDWVNKLGPTTALDSGCKSSLTDLASCAACVSAGYQVQKELIAIDELNSEEGSGGKGHSGLVFGLTGVGVAVAVMFCLLGMYFWYDRRWRRKKGEGSNLRDGHDLEEQGSKLRVRPNTGSIWYKIEELEKATDNFSQKNFIGQGSPRAFLITDWAWSLVKAGKVGEALEASLSKNDDSVNLNPKSIMERFVMVGILCAHVMVALRPTILDALKMLEGDIEVPAIPDRPTPLGHPSFCGNGNNFSISPALSGPLINSRDMLRFAREN